MKQGYDIISKALMESGQQNIDPLLILEALKNPVARFVMLTVHRVTKIIKIRRCA